MSREEGRIRRKPVSIVNWMLTIILAVIPGVNIISFVATLIFAQNRSKKSFAAAALILCAVFAVLFVAAFLIFGDQIVELAGKLNAK